MGTTRGVNISWILAWLTASLIAAVLVAPGCASSTKASADASSPADSSGTDGAADTLFTGDVAGDLAPLGDLLPGDASLDVVPLDAQLDARAPDASLDGTGDLGDTAETPDGAPSGDLVDVGDAEDDLDEPDTSSGQIGHLQIVVRTSTLPNSNTDNNQQLCLAADRCFELDNLAYNDFELGQVDHFDFVDPGLSYEEIDSIVLKTTQGVDAWRPTCIAVIADGKLLYCNDTLTVTIGDASGETLSWSDDDPTRKTCLSCFGSPITHGPMVGYTTSTTSTIWFRGGSSLGVRVVYGESADTLDHQSPVVKPLGTDDFTARIELGGLKPGTRYYYQLEAAGIRVPAAPVSLRTAPAGKGTFRVAFGSCANYTEQPIFDLVKSADPHILLMLGDAHYANTSDPSRLNFFYRRSRSIAPFAKLIAETTTLAVWDDHDFVGNNTLGTALGKENALAAFKRYWANPFYGTDGAPGVWYTFTYGDVEFFMLDDRYYRGIDKSMLGPDQLAWLLAGLEASTATFKVLVSGSQWSSHGSNDSWAQFNAERELILDHVMEKKISGVILLSGDVHYATVLKLREASATSYEIWEFSNSPFRATFFSCLSYSGDTKLFCQSGYDNFGLLHFDTTATPPRFTYESHRQDGVIPYSVTVTLDQLKLP
ncbi:MAG: alkaline phosphatase D family protein [Myxococcales bacterium]|nr:alkaline phosphatase D family protein [Myxococcales bacterium]